MKLWLRILLVVLVLLLAGAGWFGYSMYRYVTVTVPNAYAVWGAAELVIFYMDENDGAWPTSWDDLKPIHDTRDTHWIHWGNDFERLKELVEIDWNANPTELVKATDERGRPPFRVIWRRDGGKSHWESAEPNQLILDYLTGRYFVDKSLPRKDHP